MIKKIDIKTSGSNSPGYIEGNYIQFNFTIKKRLSFFDYFKKSINSLKTLLKHYSSQPIKDFPLLAEQYFSGQFPRGQQVVVTGFLSKYLLIHRPDFYVPFVQKAGDTKVEGFHVTMKIESHVNQLPIQRFPHISFQNQNLFVYFLYPPKFKGFFLEESKEKIQLYQDGYEVDDILDITYLVQPLILVSPIPLEDKTERIVKITGILNSLDEIISKIFYENITKTQREILYNTFRPYEECILSLCIDLRDKDKCTLEIKDSPKPYPAILYVETHFENLKKIKNYEQLIGKLMPKNYPGLHWASFNNKQNNITCGLANTEVCILNRNFREFAFYISTEINDKNLYQKNLSELQSFVNNYRKNIQNYIRKVYGIEVKNHFDFVFDFYKANLFHPKGVLVSKYIEDLLRKDNSLKDTIDWLRNIS